MAIDLNTASRETLTSLKGINGDMANAIIQARPFTSIEELGKIPGIGQQTLQQLITQGLFISNADEPSGTVSDTATNPASSPSIPSEVVNVPALISERRPINNASLLCLDGKQDIWSSYLRIKEPVSKSLVEFKTVSVVPLDDFYLSLYINTASEMPKTLITRNHKRSDTFKIDFRPNRWYRKYKQVLDELEFAKKDVSRYQARLQAAEEKIGSVGDAEYQGREIELEKRRDDYAGAVQKLNDIIDQKALILREIRTNGYEIAERDIPQSISEQGYTFYIFNRIPEKLEYTPIVIKPDLDFSDAAAWADVEGRLGERVASSDNLSDTDKEYYRAEAAKLKDIDANEFLVRERNRLKAEINDQERLKSILTSQLQSLFCGQSSCGQVLCGQMDQRPQAINRKINEIAQKIRVLRSGLLDLEKNGLGCERRKFFDHWNNIQITGKVKSIAYPNVDPLADFLLSIKPSEDEDNTPPETYFFKLTPDGFCTKEGFSPADIINKSNSSSDDIVAILPAFDSQRKISDEMLIAVVNPQPSCKIPDLPIIKFVETYNTEIMWKGYSIGDLSHSINLSPGEIRDIVISKQTTMASRMTGTTSQERSTAIKNTSSFEENLEQLLSSQEKSSSLRERKDTFTTNRESRREVESGSSRINYGLLNLIFGGGGSSYSYSRSIDAFMSSQQLENRTANNQSKETLKKELSNLIRKTACETSINNKVEISLTTSEEKESLLSKKEVLKIENPNIGRTVNYNFFQLQNLYETSVSLSDVQIVIDSGREIFEGSEVNDIKTFDLESFGKIFPNLNTDDLHSAILAGIVARQVIKHYGDFFFGLTSANGALTVDDDSLLNREMFEILNFSQVPSETEEGAENKVWGYDDILQLRYALTYLKSVPFVFQEMQLVDKSIEAINTGAYYLEANVGMMPATEKYLEERRNIETERQQALVGLLKSQADAKVFFPTVPEGVTSLTLANDGSQEERAALKA